MSLPNKKYSVWVRFEDIEAISLREAIDKIKTHLDIDNSYKFIILKSLMKDFYPNEKF